MALPAESKKLLVVFARSIAAYPFPGDVLIYTSNETASVQQLQVESPLSYTYNSLSAIIVQDPSVFCTGQECVGNDHPCIDGFSGFEIPFRNALLLLVFYFLRQGLLLGLSHCNSPHRIGPRTSVGIYQLFQFSRMGETEA